MNAEIRPMKTAAELGLAQAFAAASPALPGDDMIARARAAAFRHFEEQGLPHRRVEEWKYTDLRAFMREAKPIAARLAASSATARLCVGANLRRLVFVDGALAPDQSDLTDLEPGLTIASLAATLARGDRVVTERLGRTVATADVALALNTAFMGDGAVIHIAPGAKISRPLQLAFVAGSERSQAAFTRSLVVIGNDAQLTLVESHEGPDALDYQVNTALELVVGDRARCDHIKLCREGVRALHISTLMAAIGAEAQLFDTSFIAGGAVVRNQLFVTFAGENANAQIRGATLINGRQHADTTLLVDHALPGGTSRELNKAVLDGDSQNVFQGKIIVRQHAQKTDGKMMTQALLLSDTAEADNKPELEIFADDVQCGHGATAGALNEEQLFYLMARGIARPQAEALLIEAFVGEAIETIAHEGIRTALAATATQWLGARGAPIAG